jgi:site-specific DNA-methyltransferase (adenine-specific)
MRRLVQALTLRMDDTLFSLNALGTISPEPAPLMDAETRMALGQFDTPAWAALDLYDAAFGDKLGRSDLVWEFSCGRGAFLSAIPSHVPAFGTEIDPERAAEAARRTGRKVLVGDGRTVALPPGITAAIGNPPFDLSFFEEGILGRLAGILKEGQRCASIVPAYFFQTARTVLRLNEKWTLRHEFIPRDLFPGLTKPILFGIFERDDRPHLVGFRLYREAGEVKQLPERSQRLMAESFQGCRSVWVHVFATVLQELGGVADLSDIYRKVEGRRPTKNPAWKEQLRKVAYERFRKVGEGRFAMPEMAAA